RDRRGPPGRGEERREPACDRLRRGPERPGGAGGTEDVLEMRRADEPAREGHAISAEREDAPRAAERARDVERADVARPRARDPDAAHPERGREPGTGWIVDVHDRHRVGLPAAR